MRSYISKHRNLRNANMMRSALIAGLVFAMLCAHIARANVCTGRSNGEQVANPDDCGSYFVCDYSNPSRFHCSPPLLYDHRLHVCNWPDKVSCGQLQDPQPTATQPPVATPSTQPPESAFPHWPTYQPPTQSPTIATPAPQPDFYPGAARQPSAPLGFQCTYGGFYFAPHPDTCEQYFICENRQLHVHRCGRGIHWDYVRQECQYAQYAQCYSPGDPVGTGQPATSNRPVNGVPPSGQTPEATTTSTTTAEPTTTEEPTTTTSTTTTEAPVFVPSPPIVIVVPGTPDPTVAPDTTRRTTTTRWTPPTTVPTTTTTTTRRPTTTTSTTTTTTTTTTRNPTTTTYIPTTVPSTTYQESDESTANALTCQPNQPFMAHADCHKYYICIAMLPIAIVCPEKMAWDREQMQCTEEALYPCEHHPYYYF